MNSRRHFMQNTGAASAGFVLAQLSSPANAKAVLVKARDAVRT